MLIQRVLAATPGVIERVGARLPAAFPQVVSDSVLSGVARSAKALEAMPAA
jgi:serine/threonine-protein kinase HipA